MSIKENVSTPESEQASKQASKQTSLMGTTSLELCCCGTYSQRPMLWLAMSIAFLFGGWWAFGFDGIYSRYWRPSLVVTPLHWYHGVPGFLFTLALVSTIGARLYRLEGEEDDTNDDGDRLHSLYYEDGICGRIHTQTLQTLRLIALVALLLSGWATALMWAAKDWFEPGLDPFMGYVLLTQAALSTMALLCRWRQIVVEFQQVRDRRTGRYDPASEEGGM